MKKIIAIFTGLMISIMLAFAATTVFENDQVIYTVMPKFGLTEIGSVPLITSQQVVNITTGMVTNDQPNVSFGNITASNVIRSIYTNTGSYIFSGTSALTNVLNVGNSSVDVIRGRLYISSTNELGNPAVFSQTARLQIINTACDVCDRIVGLYTNMGMVCTIFTNNIAEGATNLWVRDSSGFSVDNSLYLMGSNEFVTVLAIPSITNVVIRMPTRNGHSVEDGVSRVRLFGSLAYYDNSGSNNLYSTVSFTNSTTVTLGITVETK